MQRLCTTMIWPFVLSLPSRRVIGSSTAWSLQALMMIRQSFALPAKFLMTQSTCKRKPANRRKTTWPCGLSAWWNDSKVVKKDKGGPGALSPAQRKRDKLPCLAMSKENFRLPVCLRRAGLKTVNGLAVPVKRTRTHGCPLIWIWAQRNLTFAAQTLPLTFRPLVAACQVPSLVSREAPRSRLQALLLTRPLAGLSSPRSQREWYKSEGFVGDPSCCRPLCRKEDKPGGEPFAACTTTEEMEVARGARKLWAWAGWATALAYYDWNGGF